MPLAAGDAGRVTGERQERPDPEVPEKARRRTFTAQYKQEVLAAYEAAADGEKGAILRREGLYSSLITEWRRARDAGALAGPARPPGRPAADPRDAQIARLQKEKAKLEQELAKARFVADVQSKLQALLETISEGADTEPGSKLVTDEAIALLAPQDRHPGGLPRGRGGAGHLVPAAPDQRAGAAGRPRSRTLSGSSRGRWPPPSGSRDPGRAAQRAVR